MNKKEPSASAEKDSNNTISDRVIIENYYGRLYSLFNFFKERFKFEHSLYRPMLSMCCCIANFKRIN